MRRGAVRVRRGNYAILFVLTAAVMLSYLAFSIDGGRMKVARIQAENASEAAGMAALAVVREGGSRAEALAAAQVAAERVMVMGASNPAGSRFDVDLDWGRWDWNQSPAGDNLGVPWNGGGNSTQAVTVRVQVNGGISAMFAPAIALIRGSRQGPGDTAPAERLDRVQIASVSRAAFRHRDIILVVDVSRGNEADRDTINAAIANFVSAVEDNNVPGDRLAIMAYAGETWLYELTDASGYALGPDELDGSISVFEAAFDFYPVDQIASSARDVADVIEPCYVGSDAWFNWYRHLPIDDDPEALLYPTGGNAFPYFLVGRPLWDSNPDSSADNYLRLDPGDPQDSMLLSLADLWATDAVGPCPHPIQTDPFTNEQVCPYFRKIAQAGLPMDHTQLCNALLYSEITFLGFDVRRQRSQATGLRSPLACHDGNWYEDNAFLATYTRNRVDARDCGHVGTARFIMPGVPRYGNDIDDFYHPDRSYALAGSRPGRALLRSISMFGNRANSSPEPNVVLITHAGPNCGPVMETGAFDDTNGDLCAQEVLDEANIAVQELDFLDVNLYVLSLAPPGSPGDTVLSGWHGVNRGYYVNLQADALAAELVDIADDMKIQVVQ